MPMVPDGATGGVSPRNPEDARCAGTRTGKGLESLHLVVARLVIALQQVGGDVGEGAAFRLARNEHG